SHLNAHLNGGYMVAFTCSDQIQISETGEVIGGTYPQLMRPRLRRGSEAETDDALEWRFAGTGPQLRREPRAPIHLPAISRHVRDWYWSTTSAMMYRRAALLFVLSEDCDAFRISADFYLVKYCQLVGGSLILPDVHGCYRRHGANGFGSSPVIGGEQSPADKLRHVPYGKFKASFTRHVLANFDRYVSVLGSDHAHLILAQVTPKAAIGKLLMSGRSRGGKNLKRPTLLYYRFWWRLFEVALVFGRRRRMLGNLFAGRSDRAGPRV
ncbi:MAG: hypothetical protein KDE08_12895, partial [Rhodobacteraceae bacterium]|nr:hypothetical protein [Paracoccaceae bacterium]